MTLYRRMLAHRVMLIPDMAANKCKIGHGGKEEIEIYYPY